jgi:aspartyl-tRNA(Asn)/glutamyl-tRNA(Gln) amidotransferase subunit A
MQKEIKKIPKTINEAKAMFVSGDLTPSQLVEHYFSVIKEKNSEINAVLETFEDAKLAAEIAEKNIKEGKGRVLDGIPFLVKDCILVKGHTASAGSQMLKNYTAAFDATVIKRIKDAGGIIIGRTNMDEFALGGSGENSSYGSTKNAIDTSRVPGGSSSGSASALASGMGLVALGSDTGGSVRQPAALTGIIGYKPTFGKNSRSGLIAAASSLDTIGIFANDVESIKIVESVIGGFDEMDNTSVPINVSQQIKFETNAKYKVAYPEEYLKSEGLNVEVKKNFFDTLEKLKSYGHEVVGVNMDTLKYALSMYYIINTAEVSTNLSRMEGLRFGGGYVGDVKNYQELFAKNRGKFLGPEVKRRIMIGSYVLSHGYYDAFYGKALELRTKMKKEFAEIFAKVDFLVMPTAPTTAWKFGEIKDPLSLYLEDIFTVPANLAGLPAISVPSGVDSNNMPIGFQILGPYLSDEKLLDFAKSIT